MGLFSQNKSKSTVSLFAPRNSVEHECMYAFSEKKYSEEKAVPQPEIKHSHQGEIKLVLDWGTTSLMRTEEGNKSYEFPSKKENQQIIKNEQTFRHKLVQIEINKHQLLT